VETIRDYRLGAEQLRDQALEQAMRQLRAGREPDIVLAELARQLTNKLMHNPCYTMRQAGYDGRSELLDAARELFNLKTNDN
jgi:glutamyl-tRNA reductase